jgi:hypothetical protein
LTDPKLVHLFAHIARTATSAGNRLKIVKPGITLPDYQSYSLFSAEINSLNINNHLKTK